MMRMKFGMGLCAFAIATMSAPSLAHDARRAEGEAPRTESGQVATAPHQACEQPRKKKGLGLGGILRSARSSGLLGQVAGGAGAGGYLVGSVATTAIDAAADQARERRAETAGEVRAC